ERRVAVEDEDPRLVLLAEPQLALGAEHPLRLRPADRRGPDPPISRQDGAGGGEGGAHAHLGVGRYADHGERLGAGGDAAEEQAVTVALAELALDRLDLADHDPADVGGERDHGGDLDPRVQQTIRGLGGRESQVHELPDPLVRDLHSYRTPEAGIIRGWPEPGATRLRPAK